VRLEVSRKNKTKSVRRISIPCGAIRSYEPMLAAGLLIIFQFLVVRLEAKQNIEIVAIVTQISIPCGAIRRI